jgi:hypothetical protein
MAYSTKSFWKKSIFLGIPICILAACDSIGAPHVFGDNEVPQEVVQRPRAVKSLSQDKIDAAEWQRLGDVPAAPKNFTSQELINQTKQQMHGYQEEGTQMKNAAEQ